MDEALLKNWNTAVELTDMVYIIGDLFFRNAVSANEALKRLNGKKHLLIGNHDKDWMKKTDMARHFVSVERIIEFSDGAHKITLCHYPGCMGEQFAKQTTSSMMTWNGIAS
jgi:calcineurin-like phosphoesterase family protein